MSVDLFKECMKKFLILATVLVLNHSLCSVDAPFEEERESAQKVTPQQLLSYLVAGSVSPEYTSELIEALSVLSEEQQVDLKNILSGLSPVMNTRLNGLQYFVPINAKINLVRCFSTLESSQWSIRIRDAIESSQRSIESFQRSIWIPDLPPGTDIPTLEMEIHPATKDHDLSGSDGPNVYIAETGPAIIRKLGEKSI